MNISDLTPGMIVETKRKNKYVLLRGKLMNETSGTFLPLEIYNEDLTINNDYSNNNNGNDIEKIYISNANFLNEYFEDRYLELIWERDVEIDWNKVPVDTSVYIKDYIQEDWGKRHFKNIGFEENHIVFYTWDGGCTSFTGKTSTGWKMCKLAHEEDIEKYKRR